MSEGLLEQMMRLDRTLHGPPKANVMSAAIPQAVDPFPTSPYDDPFTPSQALQDALRNAINTLATQADKDAKSKAKYGDPDGISMGNVFQMPFTITDVTSVQPPFPMGGSEDADASYFVASEAKVAVMYAAFELRAMARRFAAANHLWIQPGTGKDQLLGKMDSIQTPLFLSKLPNLPAAAAIKPSYSTVFESTLPIVFKSDFYEALRKMVVESDTAGAGTCIDAIGFSYLNGALKAGGFFDGTNGIWVGSNYNGAQPARVVSSKNDGKATLTGTTHQFAKMLALIISGRLVDKGATTAPDNNGGDGSSLAMRGFLGDAAKGGPGNPGLYPFTSGPNSPQIPGGSFKYNKLGYSFLGSKANNSINSQVSVIADPAGTGKGRTYIVAWQNLKTPGVVQVDAPSHPPFNDANVDKVRSVVVKAIHDYETAQQGGQTK